MRSRCDRLARNPAAPQDTVESRFVIQGCLLPGTGGGVRRSADDTKWTSLPICHTLSDISRLQH